MKWNISKQDISLLPFNDLLRYVDSKFELKRGFLLKKEHPHVLLVLNSHNNDKNHAFLKVIW